MIIKIEATQTGIRRTDRYSADFTELPGSPPLGFGATKEEAVAELFRVILNGSTISYRDWLLNKISTELEFVYKDVLAFK